MNNNTRVWLGGFLLLCFVSIIFSFLPSCIDEGKSNIDYHVECIKAKGDMRFGKCVVPK